MREGIGARDGARGERFGEFARSVRDFRRDHEPMPIQPVDAQATRPVPHDRGPMIRQRRPALRVQFENARFAKTGMHGERRAQQFERRTHAHRRHVFAFDFGCADHVEVFLLRRDIERITRMQQPHRPRQIDARRMYARHFAANAAQRGPRRFAAETTAIDDPMRIGHGIDGRIPVRAHAARRQTCRERFERLTVIELAFVRQQPALRETRAERRFRIADLRACEFDETAIEQRSGRIRTQTPFEKRRSKSGASARSA
jgi:hypothetical protein